MATFIHLIGLDRSTGAGYSVRRGIRLPASTSATLTTALTGTNNDLTYTAVTPGTGGNSVTVTYVVAGNSTPLTVSVTGNDITVNVATDAGGVATSTADDVSAAVAGSGAASALVTVADAAGNDGTGVVTALTKTNLAGGASGTNTMLNAGALVTVDIDNPAVRKILARNRGRWIVSPSGTFNVAIRSIEGSEGASSQSGSSSLVSRGFRIKNSSNTQTNVLADGAAVTVNVADSATRKTLAQHYDKWVEANTGNKLTTIRGLVTSQAAAGGGLSARGFRIKNQAGTQADVDGDTSVQVDLADPYARRILRRNVGRYIVVSSP